MMDEQRPPLTRDELQQAFDAALALLRGQQLAFVAQYLKDGRGRDAAIRAGYSERTATVQASRLLTIVNIKRAIDLGRQLAALDAVMDAQEVLRLLTTHARGSLGEDFLRIERVTFHARSPVPDPTDDDPKAVRWVEDPVPQERLVQALDLEKAAARGKLHLIKKFKEAQYGGIEIELYDAQAAAVQLGKYYKLFVDRTELSGPNGGAIPVGFTSMLDRVYGDDDTGSPTTEDDQPDGA